MKDFRPLNREEWYRMFARLKEEKFIEGCVPEDLNCFEVDYLIGCYLGRIQEEVT